MRDREMFYFSRSIEGMPRDESKQLPELARQYFEAGDTYPDMTRKLGGITLQHLRRLLAKAGVKRTAGRPKKPDAAKRVVSLESAGIA